MESAIDGMDHSTFSPTAIIKMAKKTAEEIKKADDVNTRSEVDEPVIEIDAEDNQNDDYQTEEDIEMTAANPTLDTQQINGLPDAIVD